MAEFRVFPTGSPHMDKPFDTTLKQMVDQNLPDWARFLGGRLNLPMPLRLSPLDGDVSTVNLQADKLFRLSGSTKAIVHVEFQTTRDKQLPRRVMRYSVLANARYDLPVYSVVMLLTRKADFAGMDGELILEHDDGSEYHRFRYDVIRVWQLPAKMLLDGGTGMMPLVMLTDEVRSDPEPAFQELVVRSKAMFPNPGHHREFIAKALILDGLHFNEAFMRGLSEKGSRLAGSSMYQIIYKKGKAEGEAAVLHRLILRWATSRFGESDGATRTKLEAICDIPRLERMSDRLTSAPSWEDLLATE